MRWIGSFVLLLGIFFSLSCQKSCAQDSKAKEEQSVFFETPKDGETLTSPFEVKFGVKGMTVRPAMEDVNDKTSGHHHLLIDSPKGFIEEGQAIPVDERHIHYGKGQTSATIELSPGVHTLSMQFADGAHLSYGKKMATTITVTITEPKAEPDGH